jgi:hypothetical protein
MTKNVPHRLKRRAEAGKYISQGRVCGNFAAIRVNTGTVAVQFALKSRLHT